MCPVPTAPCKKPARDLQFVSRRRGGTMIIDCHGHYTTSPRQHEAWRTEQIAAHNEGRAAPPRPRITDDEIRASIENGQLKQQRERGTDRTIFAPRADRIGP